MRNLPFRNLPAASLVLLFCTYASADQPAAHLKEGAVPAPWKEIEFSEKAEPTFYTLEWREDFHSEEFAKSHFIPLQELNAAETLSPESLKALRALPRKKASYSVSATGPLAQEILKAAGLDRNKRLYIKDFSAGKSIEVPLKDIQELDFDWGEPYEMPIEDVADESGGGNGMRAISKIGFITIMLPKEANSKLESQSGIVVIGSENPFLDNEMPEVPWRDSAEVNISSQAALAYLERNYEMTGAAEPKRVKTWHSCAKFDLFLTALEHPAVKDGGVFQYLIKPNGAEPLVLDTVTAGSNYSYKPSIRIGKILKGYESVIYISEFSTGGRARLFLIDEKDAKKIKKVPLVRKPSSC